MPSTKQRDLPQEDRQAAFSETVYFLWKRRWLILGVLFIFVAVTLVVSLLEKPSYRAEAIVIVQPRAEPGSTHSPQDFLSNVVGAVVQEDLLKEVTGRAGWSSGTKEFEKHLYVKDFTKDNGQAGLRVRFVGSDAKGAARAANAYATLFVDRVGQLGKSRIAGGSLAAKAEIKRKAAPPENRSSPRIALRAGLAAVVGLLAGIAAALILESRVGWWRSIKDAESVLKVPVLGTVPQYPADERGES